ncbi:DNA-binding barrel domain superfamily [Sesbania bispinosa]|nr:DNA-binding barrel domain superfamily [Sesbania bispinosa]
MSNPILLKLPNGAEWEISWESDDRGIWLKKNWNKFAQSLSLGYGYFLVFKYKGGSNFLVEVFHYNSLEIDYSSIRCINDGEGSNEHHKQIEEEDDCVEIVDPCERPTQPLKKKKTNSSEEDSDESHDMNQNTFQVHVTKYHPYCVPKWFMERHRCDGKLVKLKVEETSWDVKVINNPKMSFGRFSGGWPAFVRECKLNIGDICKFEMVDEEKLVLKVSITKCGQHLGV